MQHLHSRLCVCVCVYVCARTCVCLCKLVHGPMCFFFFYVFFFSSQHQWWSAVCCGLLFELQRASVWLNRKFEESLLCSQIRTEGDYCNDLRGRLGVCVWGVGGAGVLSLVEWRFTSLEPAKVEGGLPAKHPHRAPLVPIWFRTYLGDPSENWWKENIELILVKIEGLAAHTHPQACRRTHTHTHTHIYTYTDTHPVGHV